LRWRRGYPREQPAQQVLRRDCRLVTDQPQPHRRATDRRP